MNSERWTASMNNCPHCKIRYRFHKISYTSERDVVEGLVKQIRRHLKSCPKKVTGNKSIGSLVIISEKIICGSNRYLTKNNSLII
jgi:hypothetical protein